MSFPPFHPVTVESAGPPFDPEHLKVIAASVRKNANFSSFSCRVSQLKPVRASPAWHHVPTYPRYTTRDVTR